MGNSCTDTVLQLGIAGVLAALVLGAVACGRVTAASAAAQPAGEGIAATGSTVEDAVAPDDQSRITHAERLLARLRSVDGAQPPVPARGERAYGFERIGCRADGSAWALYYDGEYRGPARGPTSSARQPTHEQPSPRAGPGSGLLTLRARYRLTFNPEVEGVSRDDWWCIPRRRFCSGQVEFSDWQGMRAAGETATFELASLVAAHFGVEAAALHQIALHCASGRNGAVTEPE